MLLATHFKQALIFWCAFGLCGIKCRLYCLYHVFAIYLLKTSCWDEEVGHENKNNWTSGRCKTVLHGLEPQEIPSYLILRRWFLPFAVTLGHHFQSAALVLGCFSNPLYFSATISFSVHLLSFAFLPCLSICPALPWLLMLLHKC